MAVDEFSDYPDTGASGSQEYTSPEDPSIDFTSQNPRTDYEPPQPDVDYGVGATGNVSTSGRTNSGGGTGAPFIHPFKLEKFTNPDDNSTKVRIYEGDVYAKIDTFQLAIITITTGASHTHSAGGYNIPDHQHDQGGTASSGSDTGNTGAGTPHSHGSGDYIIPDHDHNLTGQTASGSDGAHTHGGVTDSGGAGSGSEGVHQHPISSNMTGGAHQHDLSSLDTAGIVNKSSNDSVTGTSGDESSHTHSYNKNDHTHTLSGETGNIYSSSSTAVTGNSGTNSNSAVDHKFVAITGQAQAPVSPVPTNFAGTFNKIIQFEDGTDTVFSYHESSHSSGDFYVKWVITISEAAAVQTIVGSIERVAVGAGAPADIPFGALTQNGSTKALERTELTGTFHQKIGSVSATTVDQVQFSNINWSMTVLPEVS